MADYDSDEIDIIDDYDEVDVDEVDIEDDEPRGGRFGGIFGLIKSWFVTPPARPGEQDIARSPFVQWLVGGIFALFIVFGIFYFMILRETAQRQFDAALALSNEGKYAQAITAFEKFVEVNAKHALVPSAHIEKGRALVKKEVETAAPKWVNGVDELKKFIKYNKDYTELFREERKNIFAFAQTITEGGARTAADKCSQEILDAAMEANIIMSRYAPEEGVTDEKKEEIKELQQTAIAAIRRKNVYEKGVSEIQALVDSQQVQQALKRRLALIQRDPGYADEPEVRKLLADTLDTEKKRIASENVTGANSNGNDWLPELPKPITVTTNTRASTSESAGDDRCLAVGADSLYSVETVTGQPDWSRPIGLNTPFNPVLLTSDSSVLLFDTYRHALVKINQADGSLIWEQPIQHDVVGPPLVHENNIFIGTLGREMLRLNLESGEIKARTVFSQPLLSPPTISDDGQRLIVVGDEGLVYTLDILPTAIKTVTWLGHAAGSVKTPLTKMAKLYIMCENDNSNSCRIRVLRANAEGTELVEAASARVDGHVVNPPIVRGRFLFVPSTVQRITAFTISDDPEQAPITRIATQKLQDVADADMYLQAGPAGQLWLFSRSLRKFEMKTDSIKIDSKEAAAGLATQPIQQKGEKFYLARTPAFGKSTFLTETHNQTLEGYWRTVVGANVLAIAEDNGSLNGVSDTGSVFRLTPKEIGEGGYQVAPSAQLTVDGKTKDLTGAVRFPDGRIGFYAGQPDPSLWIINRVGKMDQRLRLPGALQTAPAAIEAGIVAPLEKGRLTLVGGRPGPVDDYQLPQGQGAIPPWKFVVPVDKDSVAAVNAGGNVIRVRYSSSPTRNLSAVSTYRTRGPVDVSPAVSASFVAVADSGRNLVLLEKQGFEPRGQFALPAPATNDLWMTDLWLFVEVGTRQLFCFNTEQPKLVPAWNIPLTGSLAGAPYVSGERILIAQRNGVIKTVDIRGNAAGDDLTIGQNLQHAPLKVGNSLMVGTVGGTFFRIESLLNGD